ncbi:MAG: rRNA maturation RNase YbeY [Cellulosilyticaceae bacterium]
MNIYLEDEYDFFKQHEDILSNVRQVIEECLKTEHVQQAIEVSLTVVDEQEIQMINKEQRNIDRVTDVLSFPQIEARAQGGIEWEVLELNGHMNLDTQDIMLGDIVLCYEVAKKQAEEYGHSLEREVCFLVAHSMFHLLGYDHMTEEEEKVMITKQENVLSNLGITR